MKLTDYDEILRQSLTIILDESKWDFACVSTLSEGKEVATPLCFIGPDGEIPAIEFDVFGTPCQRVVKQDDVVYYSDMSEVFVDDSAILLLQVQSYIGMVYYIGGKQLGHVFLMSKKNYNRQAQQQIAWILRLLSLFIGSRVELIQKSCELSEERRMATTDPLTSLLNRRAFNNYIDRVIALNKRKSLTDGLLVMFDIDGLKAVNDNLGHQVGDDLICFIAQLIRHGVRIEDQVYRLGGDEFAVLFTGNAIKAKAMLTARIDEWHQLIKQSQFKSSGLSLGMALLSEVEGEKKAWIHLADTRLYQNKLANKSISEKA